MKTFPKKLINMEHKNILPLSAEEFESWKVVIYAICVMKIFHSIIT